jgi:imidazoleglycerol-phosphate dehydratase
MRTATINRKTKETEIAVEINLTGSGIYQISTGIGFFDHMLTQIAVHGLFDLNLTAKGDLDVDPHHTVEDCGLGLGAAFAKALGDKAGIVRTASAVVPMDEALAEVVLDFSGRPFSVIQANWSSPMVGGLPTTLLEHFFQSFAVASAANLHLQVRYGRDNHHMAEALFKAFGRAASQAVMLDPRREGAIPSSKGTLS